MRVSVLKKQYLSYIWENPNKEIVLTDISAPRTSSSFESKKDNFNFTGINAQNQYFETFFSGDGSSTAFTLRWSPIPSSYLGTEKFEVFVDDVLKTNSVDYTVSGSTLGITSAPDTGNDNVKVRFKLLEEDDLITMWRFKNDAYTNLTPAEKDAAIVVQGVITNITTNIAEGGRLLGITGEGLSNTLFNALVSVGYDATINRSHLAVQKVILEANKLNQGRKIFGEDEDEWTTLSNDTTSRELTFSSSYRNASLIIDELSAPESTGDGRYGWNVLFNPRSGTATTTVSDKLVDTTASFTDGLNGLTVYNTTDSTDATITAVDSATALSISSDIFASSERYSIKTFDFNWNKKSGTAVTTITEGNNASVIGISTDADEIKNVIIYNVGTSPRGNPQNFLYFNPVGPGGARFDYVTATNQLISQTIDDEFQARKDDSPATWTFTTDDDGKKHRAGNFPSSYGTSYTMQFKDRNAAGVVQAASAVTVTDDGEFDKTIIKEARFSGRDKVLEIVEFNSEFKNKVKMTIPYTADSNGDSYLLGRAYTINVDSYKIHDIKMRLNQIDYETADTILTFKEEPDL